MQPVVRCAEAKDASEIVRLARVMWVDMGWSDTAGPWEEDAVAHLSDGFADGTSRTFVADDPDDVNRLVACGCATVLRLPPAFWLPSGRMGYIHWMSTESSWRGNGLASIILDRLIEWFASQGITHMQLHGTPSALPLYERKGFGPSLFDNMWLRL